MKDIRWRQRRRARKYILPVCMLLSFSFLLLATGNTDAFDDADLAAALDAARAAAAGEEKVTTTAATVTLADAAVGEEKMPEEGVVPSLPVTDTRKADAALGFDGGGVENTDAAALADPAAPPEPAEGLAVKADAATSSSNDFGLQMPTYGRDEAVKNSLTDPALSTGPAVRNEPVGTSSEFTSPGADTGTVQQEGDDALEPEKEEHREQYGQVDNEGGVTRTLPSTDRATAAASDINDAAGATATDSSGEESSSWPPTPSEGGATSDPAPALAAAGADEYNTMEALDDAGMRLLPLETEMTLVDMESGATLNAEGNRAVTSDGNGQAEAELSGIGGGTKETADQFTGTSEEAAVTVAVAEEGKWEILHGVESEPDPPQKQTPLNNEAGVEQAEQDLPAALAPGAETELAPATREVASSMAVGEEGRHASGFFNAEEEEDGNEEAMIMEATSSEVDEKQRQSYDAAAAAAAARNEVADEGYDPSLGVMGSPIDSAAASEAESVGIAESARSGEASSDAEEQKPADTIDSESPTVKRRRQQEEPLGTAAKTSGTAGNGASRRDWGGVRGSGRVGAVEGMMKSAPARDDMAQRVREMEEEILRKILGDEDAKSLLDIWVEKVREFVLTKTVPPTDAQCDFNWSRLRCEPKCSCGVRLRFGDYTPGRACRLLHPWEQSPHCEDTWDPSDEPAVSRFVRAVGAGLGGAKRSYEARIAPPTDSECTFSLEARRCEPQDLCRLRPRWGDLTLSSACRLTKDKNKEPVAIPARMRPRPP